MSPNSNRSIQVIIFMLMVLVLYSNGLVNETDVDELLSELFYTESNTSSPVDTTRVGGTENVSFDEKKKKQFRDKFLLLSFSHVRSANVFLIICVQTVRSSQPVKVFWMFELEPMMIQNQNCIHAKSFSIRAASCERRRN